MGNFQCPIDFEDWINFDCRTCQKYMFHEIILKKYGVRGTCKKASSMRAFNFGKTQRAQKI